MPPRRKPAGGRAAPKKKQTMQDKLKKLIQDFLSADGTGEGKAPGIAVAIRGKGQSAFVSFGYANIDADKLIGPGTLFNIAALTKQFTAIGILILIERGQISLTDELKKFFPDTKYTGITIVHLLNTSAGFREHDDVLDILWNKRAGQVIDHKKDQRPTTKDVTDLFTQFTPSLHFEPGKSETFNGTPYVFLARIIEIVSGKSYAEFLKEEIFAKVGMNNTVVYLPENPPGEVEDNSVYLKDLAALVGNDDIALGYKAKFSEPEDILAAQDEEDDEIDELGDFEGWKVKVENYLNAVAGDCGIYSTITDLLVWVNVLNKDLGKLITQETWESSLEALKVDGELVYACGQKVDIDENEQYVYEHAGSWTGYNAIIRRIPAYDSYIVALANTESYSSFELADAITATIFED